LHHLTGRLRDGGCLPDETAVEVAATCRSYVDAGEVPVDGGSGDPKVSAISCTVCCPAAYIARACLTRFGVILSFGPPLRPRARAAASPSWVRSTIRSCSNSAIAASMWKNSRPPGVVVSIPWDSARSPTSRACRSSAKVLRLRTDRPSRSSLVMRVSPSRR